MRLRPILLSASLFLFGCTTDDTDSDDEATLEGDGSTVDTHEGDGSVDALEGDDALDWGVFSDALDYDIPESSDVVIDVSDTGPLDVVSDAIDTDTLETGDRWDCQNIREVGGTTLNDTYAVGGRWYMPHWVIGTRDGFWVVFLSMGPPGEDDPPWVWFGQRFNHDGSAVGVPITISHDTERTSIRGTALYESTRMLVVYQLNTPEPDSFPLYSRYVEDNGELTEPVHLESLGFGFAFPRLLSVGGATYLFGEGYERIDDDNWRLTFSLARLVDGDVFGDVAVFDRSSTGDTGNMPHSALWDGEQGIDVVWHDADPNSPGREIFYSTRFELNPLRAGVLQPLGLEGAYQDPFLVRRDSGLHMFVSADNGSYWDPVYFRIVDGEIDGAENSIGSDRLIFSSAYSSNLRTAAFGELNEGSESTRLRVVGGSDDEWHESSIRAEASLGAPFVGWSGSFVGVASDTLESIDFRTFECY